VALRSEPLVPDGLDGPPEEGHRFSGGEEPDVMPVIA
jgi:hypothetical protein